MFLTALLAATLAAPVPKASADYWPHTVGDRWVYTQDGQEVTAVTEKDGETRVTTTYSDGPGSNREMEYVLKEGAVCEAKDGPFTFDPPVRRLELDLRAGARWGSKTPPTKGVGCTGGEMAVGEEEEVTVPAGTFQVLPVTYTVTEVRGKAVATPTVYTFWYAVRVGLVKLKYDVWEKVLKAFTPGRTK